MPTRDHAWPAGTPCWVDYAATDLTAAQNFYKSVLGWTFTESNEEYGGYSTVQMNGHDVGGMMPKMSPEMSSFWNTYFASDNVEQTAEAVTSAGGSVVAGPMQVSSFGTMLVALDPLGATFGVWQSGETTGFQIYNEPGAVVWNEGHAADQAAAEAFYGSVFGVTFDEPEGMEGYHILTVDGEGAGALTGVREPTPPGWHTYFAVESADDAAAKAEANGGSVLMPPTTMPFGRFAIVADPWGAMFSVLRMPDEA